MPEDEVDLSESLSDSGEDLGLASDADEIDYGDAAAFPDQPGPDADLSGFAEEAGDEASYGFENAYDTGSFQADEAELRDDLLGDANLQDSGEYTLPEDALIEGPDLAEEAAGLDPEEIPLPPPVIEGEPAEFSSEVSPGLEGGYDDAGEAGGYDDAAGYGAGEYDAGDYADAGGYAEGEYAPQEEYGSEASYDETGAEYAEEGSDYADAGGYAEGEYAEGEYAEGEYAEGEYAPQDEYGAAPVDGGYDEDEAQEAAPAADVDEGDDDANKANSPNRPGQIAKSALDDIFARAKKLKND